MSSVALLTVFPFFLPGVLATIFPPVSNSPPIPGQAVRQMDIPQNYYFTDDLQPNLQQSVLRDDDIYPPELKVDDQRWFIPENQSGENGDYPNSSEAFERYYSNGLPAVGPVATPLPDDAYVAQQTGTSKIVPDGPPNGGSSDIWVLTKGSDNQYVPERWVRIPSERVVQVINQDGSPKVVGDAVRPIQFPPPIPDIVKSSPLPPPPPPPAVKSQFPPSPPPVAPSNAVRQIWIRAPNVIDPKFYQSQATFVDDFSPVNQVVDIPSPNVQQIVQPQLTKQIQFPPSPQQISVISKKPAPLPLPPPPSPPAPLPIKVPPPVAAPIKGRDQIVISAGSITAIPDGPSFIIGKDGSMPPMRHIWIPTSQQTGKFISLPATSVVDTGKSISAKGALSDGSPVSVSDTWVLKQDGPIPRFETQNSAFPPVQSPVVAVPNPNIAVENTPLIQMDSPKNPSLFGKNVNIPLDIWPVRKDFLDSKVISKSGTVPVFPTPSKSGSVVIRNAFPDPSVVPQKSYIPNGKMFAVPPPPPPPPAGPVAVPAASVVKDRPCPIPPQKFVQPLKTLIPPAAPRIITAGKRPPFSRILRVNRYPFGSYYVLTSRAGSNIYAYPRPAAVVRQAKNGAVRLVPSNAVPLPVPARQVAVPVPAKQLTVPLASKSSLIYPGAPAMSRIRYAYPWAGLLKSYPMPGRNVFPILPVGSPLPNPGTLKASGSDSSSPEGLTESSPAKPTSRRSRKIESKKAERTETKKPEPKEPEPKKPVPPESSSESSSEEKVVEKLEDRKSEESEEQAIENSEEAKSTESNESSEEESASQSAEPETDFDTAESQVSPVQILKTSAFQNEEDSKLLSKPYIFGYDQRDSAGTIQHHKQIADIEGIVRGTYGYRDAVGLYRNVKFIADQNGYRAHVISNEPSVTNHESANANFVASKSPETLLNQGTVPEALQVSRENLTTDFQRD